MTPAKNLLCELIALPSVNNALLPADHPRAGEARVADFLAATAAKAGLDVDLQEALPGRRNLLVTLSPPGKVQRRVVLAPHLDTVNVASDDQLNPRQTGGRIYGRGACDTKGSVAAMFTALLTVAESKQRPKDTEIIFAGLIDEEIGQAGSRALAASGFKADLAIVGEPTLLKIVTAHKGNLWLQLETKGKAAHGSRPELGRNAVHEMCQIVDLLETQYAALLAKRTHPLLGRATVNVGKIRGGVQANIVPSHCSITIDRRTLPGETDAAVWKEIKALLKQNGLSATLKDDKFVPCLPLETDAKLPLVSQFRKIAGQRKSFGVTYFCDASVLAQGGTPSVVFGPGDVAQAHTSDEWISIESLENGTKLLTRFLQSLP